MKFKALEKTFVKIKGEFKLFNKGDILNDSRRHVEGFKPFFEKEDLNQDGKVDKKDKSLAGKTLVKKIIKKKKFKKSKK